MQQKPTHAQNECIYCAIVEWHLLNDAISPTINSTFNSYIHLTIRRVYKSARALQCVLLLFLLLFFYVSTTIQLIFTIRLYSFLRVWPFLLLLYFHWIAALCRFRDLNCHLTTAQYHQDIIIYIKCKSSMHSTTCACVCIELIFE